MLLVSAAAFGSPSRPANRATVETPSLYNHAELAEISASAWLGFGVGAHLGIGKETQDGRSRIVFRPGASMGVGKIGVAANVALTRYRGISPGSTVLPMYDWLYPFNGKGGRNNGKARVYGLTGRNVDEQAAITGEQLQVGWMMKISKRLSDPVMSTSRLSLSIPLTPWFTARGR